MNKLISLLALLCISFFSASAQSDEINISAAFSSSIDLRIASGANVNFTFSSLNDYNNGKMGYSVFEVASSVNFSIFVSMTPFTNADGEEINPKNLTYWVGVPEARSSEENSRWVFAPSLTNREVGTTHQGIYHGGVNYATSTPNKVLAPGPTGNAGGYSDNEYYIHFRMGILSHRSMPEIDMPSLLDQNIAPGTYTCTVTLEAIPEAL